MYGTLVSERPYRILRSNAAPQRESGCELAQTPCFPNLPGPRPGIEWIQEAEFNFSASRTPRSSGPARERMDN